MPLAEHLSSREVEHILYCSASGETLLAAPLIYTDLLGRLLFRLQTQYQNMCPTIQVFR